MFLRSNFLSCMILINKCLHNTFITSLCAVLMYKEYLTISCTVYTPSVCVILALLIHRSTCTTCNGNTHVHVNTFIQTIKIQLDYLFFGV